MKGHRRKFRTFTAERTLRSPLLVDGPGAQAPTRAGGTSRGGCVTVNRFRHETTQILRILVEPLHLRRFSFFYFSMYDVRRNAFPKPALSHRRISQQCTFAKAHFRKSALSQKHDSKKKRFPRSAFFLSRFPFLTVAIDWRQPFTSETSQTLKHQHLCYS